VSNSADKKCQNRNKTSIASLSKPNCPVSNLIYKACKLSLETELQGIEYMFDENYVENLDDLDENLELKDNLEALYLEKFFDTLSLWVTLRNMNYDTIEKRLEGCLEEQKEKPEYYTEYLTSQNEIEVKLWTFIKQAYQISKTEKAEDLIDFVKKELQIDKVFPS